MNTQLTNDLAIYEGDIPESRLTELQEKIDKLNRRAKRLGCEPIQIIVGEPFTAEKNQEYFFGGFEWKTRKVRVTCYHVVVTGQRPKLGNYRLVARVQLIEDTQFLHLVPGETLPKEYHSTTNRCDHCGVNRYRNDVYVVRDATTDDLKVVGSTCISDFLPGRTPQQMAFYAESLALIDCRDYEGLGRGYGSSQNYFDVEEYLAYSAMIIRMEGWVSKKYAFMTDGRVRPTASIAAEAYHGQLYIDPVTNKLTHEKDWEGIPFEHASPTELDRGEATAAIEWARALETDDNDYLINCHKLADLSYAPWNLTGIAASIISAHQRHVGRLAAQAQEKLVSQHVGTVGKRLKGLKLTVRSIFEHEGYYGMSHIHTMVDETGNQFTWFATSERLEEGATYTLDGTVKKHDEYKGIKKTVLSRCTVK